MGRKAGLRTAINQAPGAASGPGLFCRPAYDSSSIKSIFVPMQFGLLLSASPLPGWLESLIGADKKLFRLINQDWVSGLGDLVFPILREPKTWIPLYALVLFYALYHMKWKKAGLFVLFAIICITLTDQLSSQVLKSLFDRLRPCQDPDMQAWVRLLVDACPGNASFTSSHAVNHFGIGTFFYLSLKPYMKRWAGLFFLWAFSICWAQVYVGVHFPGDVLCGALVGLLLGGLVAQLYALSLSRLRRYRNGERSSAENDNR